MCISWYDMTLSCSVPPTSTWCHSGGSYELTVPVYNFLQANISVLYNSAHAYWLDFSTQTLHTFPAVLVLVQLTLAFHVCMRYNTVGIALQLALMNIIINPRPTCVRVTVVVCVCLLPL